MSLILSGTDGLSDVDGSAATPAIRGTDANTGIFFPAADTIGFAEGGAEAARIDSGGNFGLGVTPSAWRSNTRAIQIGQAGSLAAQTSTGLTYLSSNWYEDTAGTDRYISTTYASQYYQLSGTHVWRTAASGTAGNAITFTQAMTLDASGNLGIGTTSVGTRLDVDGNTTTGAIVRIRSSSYNSSGMTFKIGTDASCLFGTVGAVPLIFATNDAEKARIDSSGNLLVGTTASWGGAPKMEIKQTTSTAWGLSSYNSNTVSGGALLLRVDNTAVVLAGFYYTGSVLVGSITTNGTTTSYVTSSDYRLKEDIQPMTGALAKVVALNPVTYKWKSSGEQDNGFIAHELQAVCPSAVTGAKDAVDEKGNPKYQGIDTSFLVATLTAAIKEQQAIIESLKARLDAANL
jgi:hypothetical protein